MVQRHGYPVIEKNKTCLVVDMRQANKAIKRCHHPIPTLEELLEKFNGCTVFSKLDLKHGYHLIELAPESRYITVFSSHRGVFQNTRLAQKVQIQHSNLTSMR